MAQRASGFERIAADEYMTPHWPVEALLRELDLHGVFWDPACGTGNMLEAIEAHSAAIGLLKTGQIVGTDINQTYDPDGIGLDFTDGMAGFIVPERGPLNIITNPPYGERGRLAESFIGIALQMTAMVGGTVSMLLPVDFDSAKGRACMFKDCPAFDAKLTLVKRIRWTNLEQKPGSGPSQNHAWFHWNHQRRSGLPVIGYLGGDA